MHPLRTVAAGLLLLSAMTACGGRTVTVSVPADARNRHGATGSLSARNVFEQLAASVGSIRKTGVVTAGNDPGHLLGRHHEYLSKVTFSDSFVAGSDVTGSGRGEVERGGAVEVFATRSDARARAAYIRGVTRAMPAFAERDYLRGRILVRVSRYLDAARAEAYSRAVDQLT
ncbi:hypothetical protein [Streptomyces tropicalis]|uniref:Lipoprotein n=1 Tax=Streptomyces tropicalis TaxID=3034234 RepID=A0ABT6A3H2_9ACTN|nr:hypothetical protein [Streptomyces tropicalis]MDF3299199.1 hypothetical protein [Streptomyces tropicalis]